MVILPPSAVLWAGLSCAVIQLPREESQMERFVKTGTAPLWLDV